MIKKSKNIKYDEMVQHCKLGRPSLYDADKHIALLFELFDQGKDICHFCSEASIARNTFDEWRKNHPEFKIAFDIALQRAEKFCLEEGDKYCHEQGFNDKYWSRKMMNRFGYANARKVSIPGIEATTSIIETFNMILREGVIGNITPNETQVLTGALLTGIKIVESIETVKRLDEIESYVGLGEE